MSDDADCEMFAMFDPEGELISVFPARDLAQAVQIRPFIYQLKDARRVQGWA